MVHFLERQNAKTKCEDKKARKALVEAAKASISRANLGKDRELINSGDSVVGIVGVSVVRNRAVDSSEFVSMS